MEALAQIRALCDEREHGPGPGWIPVDELRRVLDAASVDATPPQGIDREQARIAAWRSACVVGEGRYSEVQQLAAILAPYVLPGVLNDGVAPPVLVALRRHIDSLIQTASEASVDAVLAARLEASA